MLAWRSDCPPIRLVEIADAGNALHEHHWLPDLSDPATVGCLRALVERDGRVMMPHVPVNSTAVWWRLERIVGLGSAPVMVGKQPISGTALVEALVEAMEHAPPVGGG
jgi:hypothetical protein